MHANVHRQTCRFEKYLWAGEQQGRRHCHSLYPAKHPTTTAATTANGDDGKRRRRRQRRRWLVVRSFVRSFVRSRLCTFVLAARKRGRSCCLQGEEPTWRVRAELHRVLDGGMKGLGCGSDGCAHVDNLLENLATCHRHAVAVSSLNRSQSEEHTNVYGGELRRHAPPLGCSDT